MTPFIEGWNFVQVLGEGAYGEVKLAVNEENDTAVAVKIIPLSSDPKKMQDIRKELCIQKMCNHPNIIKLYGNRQDTTAQYFLMEYASGGELFDRIEPDIGMAHAEAQRLFRQLIGGVEYLFERGVTHRDLKPENLLLDEQDNLKITDFGLATVYRHKGKERKLEKCCGTYPYVSPEVLAGGPYYAEPGDVWSCGIILVAMLAGELPWDQPHTKFPEYRNWTSNCTHLAPFSKLDVLSLSLLKKILEPSPSKRWTIADIKNHKWYNKAISKDVKTVTNGQRIGSKRLCSGHSLSPLDQTNWSMSGFSYSQPQSFRDGTDDTISDNPVYSFSQPIHPDNMLLSQIPCTPGSSQSAMQRLVKRMTRYYVIGSGDQVVVDLDNACTRLGYNYKKNSPNTFTVSTTDRRNMHLAFKVCIMDIDGLLLDFRLSRGDGIEFKKCFTRLKNELDCLVCYDKEPPMLSQA